MNGPAAAYARGRRHMRALAAEVQTHQRKGPPNDAERAAFLTRLDATPVEVTDREVGFLENNLGRQTFTPGQRTVIDGLLDKYAGQL